MPSLIPTYPITPPTDQEIRHQKIKGLILIALGITTIALAIFGALLCLGVPAAVPVISNFIASAHPIICGLIGAGGIIISALGIFVIYKGSCNIKEANKKNKYVEEAKKITANITKLAIIPNPEIIKREMFLDKISEEELNAFITRMQACGEALNEGFIYEAAKIRVDRNYGSEQKT